MMPVLDTIPLVVATSEPTITRGAWLLAASGAAVGPVVPGSVVVDTGQHVDGGTPRLLAVSGMPGTVAYPDEIPLVAADLEELRAAALVEIARLRSARATTTYQGVTYGIGQQSALDWLSLMALVDADQDLAAGAIDWPVPFVAYDGKVVELPDASAARALFLAIGGAAMAIANTATLHTQAVRAAATVADLRAAVIAARAALEAP